MGDWFTYQYNVLILSLLELPTKNRIYSYGIYYQMMVYFLKCITPTSEQIFSFRIIGEIAQILNQY